MAVSEFQEGVAAPISRRGFWKRDTWKKIPFTIENVGDGLLRLRSEQLPGLLLSGKDEGSLLHALNAALPSMLERNHGVKARKIIINGRDILVQAEK